MKNILEQYRNQFIIDIGLFELEEVSEERNKELMKEYAKVYAAQEKEFFEQNNVQYDDKKNKFYDKIPLELTDSEIKELRLYKNFYLMQELQQGLHSIKNILVFLCILGVLLIIVIINT